MCPNDILLKESKNSDAIVTLLTDNINKQFLDDNSHLKIVSQFAVGCNNIDHKYAATKKIPIGNTPNVLSDATADVAVGLLIATARKFKTSNDSIYQGKWKTFDPKGFLGKSLKGKNGKNRFRSR